MKLVITIICSSWSWWSRWSRWSWWWSWWRCNAGNYIWIISEGLGDGGRWSWHRRKSSGFLNFVVIIFINFVNVIFINIVIVIFINFIVIILLSLPWFSFDHHHLYLDNQRKDLYKYKDKDNDGFAWRAKQIQMGSPPPPSWANLSD